MDLLVTAYHSLLLFSRKHVLSYAMPSISLMFSSTLLNEPSCKTCARLIHAVVGRELPGSSAKWNGWMLSLMRHLRNEGDKTCVVQAAFDVRWCRGPVGEVIIKPWAERLQACGVQIEDRAASAGSAE